MELRRCLTIVQTPPPVVGRNRKIAKPSQLVAATAPSIRAKTNLVATTDDNRRRRSRQLPEDNQEAREQLALELTTLGKSGGGVVHGVSLTSEECFAKVVEADPTNSDAWFNFATAGGGLFKGSRRSKKECLETALELDGTKAIVWAALGKEGGGVVASMVHSAKDCFIKSLEINPTFAGGWYGLATCGGGPVAGRVYNTVMCCRKVLQLGDQEEDQENNSIFLELSEIKASAWTIFGIEHGGSLNEVFFNSQDCYKRAIKIKPDQNVAWNNLGVLRAQADNSGSQAGVVRKPSSGKRPTDTAEFWFNMANSLGGGRVGNQDYSAKECLIKVLEIDVRHPRAWACLEKENGAMVNNISYTPEECLMKHNKISERGLEPDSMLPNTSARFRTRKTRISQPLVVRRRSADFAFAQTRKPPVHSKSLVNAKSSSVGRVGTLASHSSSGSRNPSHKSPVFWVRLGKKGGGEADNQQYTAQQCFVNALDCDAKNAAAWKGLAKNGGGMVGGTFYDPEACMEKFCIDPPRKRDRTPPREAPEHRRKKNQGESSPHQPKAVSVATAKSPTKARKSLGTERGLFGDIDGRASSLPSVGRSSIKSRRNTHHRSRANSGASGGAMSARSTFSSGRRSRSARAPKIGNFKSVSRGRELERTQGRVSVKSTALTRSRLHSSGSSRSRGSSVYSCASADTEWKSVKSSRRARNPTSWILKNPPDQPHEIRTFALDDPDDLASTLEKNPNDSAAWAGLAKHGGGFVGDKFYTYEECTEKSQDLSGGSPKFPRTKSADRIKKRKMPMKMSIKSSASWKSDDIGSIKMRKMPMTKSVKSFASWKSDDMGSVSSIDSWKGSESTPISDSVVSILLRLSEQGGGSYQGRYLTAAQCLETILEANPYHATAWALLASENGGPIRGQFYNRARCLKMHNRAREKQQKENARSPLAKSAFRSVKSVYTASTETCLLNLEAAIKGRQADGRAHQPAIVKFDSVEQTHYLDDKELVASKNPSCVSQRVQPIPIEGSETKNTGINKTMSVKSTPSHRDASPVRTLKTSNQIRSKVNYWLEMSDNGGGTINGAKWTSNECLTKALDVAPRDCAAWRELGLAGGGACFGETFSPVDCMTRSLEYAKTSEELKVGWIHLGLVGGGTIDDAFWNPYDCYAEGLGIDPVAVPRWLDVAWGLTVTVRGKTVGEWLDMGHDGGGETDEGVLDAQSCFGEALAVVTNNLEGWMGLVVCGGGEVNGTFHTIQECYEEALSMDETFEELCLFMADADRKPENDAKLQRVATMMVEMLRKLRTSC